uniref:Uncharacterized protein n=1 Tax=Arundo donax TaxID=35708 RepID=A0A0A8XX49_ARUDO
MNIFFTFFRYTYINMKYLYKLLIIFFKCTNVQA